MSINIRRAQIEDIAGILRVRNLDNVRKLSGNSEIIQLEDHCHWFKNKYLSAHTDSFCYVITEEEKIQGYCRLDQQSNGPYIVSIALSEEVRSKGVGSQILNKAIEESVTSSTRIHAKVDKNNEVSINFFKKNHFSYLEEDQSFIIFEKIT